MSYPIPFLLPDVTVFLSRPRKPPLLARSLPPVPIRPLSIFLRSRPTMPRCLSKYGRNNSIWAGLNPPFDRLKVHWLPSVFAAVRVCHGVGCAFFCATSCAGKHACGLQRMFLSISQAQAASIFSSPQLSTHRPGIPTSGAVSEHRGLHTSTTIRQNAAFSFASGVWCPRVRRRIHHSKNVRLSRLCRHLFGEEGGRGAEGGYALGVHQRVRPTRSSQTAVCRDGTNVHLPCSPPCGWLVLLPLLWLVLPLHQWLVLLSLSLVVGSRYLLPNERSAFFPSQKNLSTLLPCEIRECRFLRFAISNFKGAVDVLRSPTKMRRRETHVVNWAGRV